ncbi:MAG: tetratricopeptide repeat protein [bacterium]|nr:tetratricopeptide repeat protein [bacterium]
MKLQIVWIAISLMLFGTAASGQGTAGADAKTDSAQVYFDEGKALLGANKPAEALTCFERAVAINPNYMEGWRGKGVALMFLDRQDEALSATEKALALKPDDLKALKNRGRILMRLGKNEEALKSFQKASELKPDDDEALMGQFAMLRELNRVDDMIKVLDRLIALKPDDPERWLRKAMETAEAGRPEVSLEALNKLDEMLPDNASIPISGGQFQLTKDVIWICRGQDYMALNRLDEALSALDRAVKMDPKNLDGWNIRGTILAKMKKFDEAVASYDKAAQLKPDLADPVYNRACAYALKGDKLKALTDLKKAIAMSGDCKAAASKDEDFKSLWSDPEFKKITE